MVETKFPYADHRAGYSNKACVIFCGVNIYPKLHYKCCEEYCESFTSGRQSKIKYCFTLLLYLDWIRHELHMTAYCVRHRGNSLVSRIVWKKLTYLETTVWSNVGISTMWLWPMFLFMSLTTVNIPLQHQLCELPIKKVASLWRVKRVEQE